MQSDGVDEFRKRSNTAGAISKENAKRWTKRENSANLELRCSIDPELLRNNLEKSNYLEDERVRLSGSVFHKRADYDYLLSIIPPAKFNGIHIKMEDDCPQGGDDVRLCLLKSLGARNLREVPCVMCHNHLPVYDKYPLIDGTFYLSPVCQYGYQVEVLFDNKRFFLQQICVECLWSNWNCNICQRAGWFLGQTYILGTLYTFDIVSSAKRCCSPRCSYCQMHLSISPLVVQQLMQGCYTLLNEKIACTACGSCNYHCIRHLDEITVAKFQNQNKLEV
ncbi:hypothetical protein WR25_10202 [Diploscapter pachys]|uniref:Headcase middle domain-containing protein n=1 Tax=Diploscapter pachys TaxID=2018661 RepID=A0A2A2LCP9_9BILA|nr:hypothetical protein WR25_10202 [Diploscapter pachys]